MKLYYEEHFEIKDFLINNRQVFEESLLNEAITVRDKIEEIHRIGNINLLANAHKLVLFVVEECEAELISFAKQEGKAWAKHSLTLSFKLEWVQAIRKTLWEFLYHFDLFSGKGFDRDKFFAMQKNVNELIDQFLSHFFISYSKYKDELIEKQRELVENLSVPIIPIDAEICVLPLIGTFDDLRIATIQEKILTEIESRHIQTLIIDLSGVVVMDPDIINDFNKIIDGISIMGCRTILTGIRAEIAKSFVALGTSFDQVNLKGTLQQALKDVIKKKE